jgi:hypothetical protein
MDTGGNRVSSLLGSFFRDIPGTLFPKATEDFSISGDAPSAKVGFKKSPAAPVFTGAESAPNRSAPVMTGKFGMDAPNKVGAQTAATQGKPVGVGPSGGDFGGAISSLMKNPQAFQTPFMPERTMNLAPLTTDDVLSQHGLGSVGPFLAAGPQYPGMKETLGAAGHMADQWNRAYQPAPDRPPIAAGPSAGESMAQMIGLGMQGQRGAAEAEYHRGMGAQAQAEAKMLSDPAIRDNMLEAKQAMPPGSMEQRRRQAEVLKKHPFLAGAKTGADAAARAQQAGVPLDDPWLQEWIGVNSLDVKDLYGGDPRLDKALTKQFPQVAPPSSSWLPVFGGGIAAGLIPK